MWNFLSSKDYNTSVVHDEYEICTWSLQEIISDSTLTVPVTQQFHTLLLCRSLYSSGTESPGHRLAQDTWSRESVAGDCCNLSIFIKYALSDYKYLCAAINDGDFWDLTLNSAANLSDWLGSWQKQRDRRSLALPLRKSQAPDHNGTWWSLNECTWPQSDEASAGSDQRGKCQIVSLYFLSFLPCHLDLDFLPPVLRCFPHPFLSTESCSLSTQGHFTHEPRAVTM